MIKYNLKLFRKEIYLAWKLKRIGKKLINNNKNTTNTLNLLIILVELQTWITMYLENQKKYYIHCRT